MWFFDQIGRVAAAATAMAKTAATSEPVCVATRAAGFYGVVLLAVWMHCDCPGSKSEKRCDFRDLELWELKVAWLTLADAGLTAAYFLITALLRAQRKRSTIIPLKLLLEEVQRHAAQSDQALLDAESNEVAQDDSVFAESMLRDFHLRLKHHSTSRADIEMYLHGGMSAFFAYYMGLEFYHVYATLHKNERWEGCFRHKPTSWIFLVIAVLSAFQGYPMLDDILSDKTKLKQQIDILLENMEARLHNLEDPLLQLVIA